MTTAAEKLARDISLEGGEWVWVDGVARWVEDPPVIVEKPTRGPKAAPNVFRRDEEELLRADRQFRAGIFDDWTREGHRNQKRITQARLRARRRQEAEDVAA